MRTAVLAVAIVALFAATAAAQTQVAETNESTRTGWQWLTDREGERECERVQPQ